MLLTRTIGFFGVCLAAWGDATAQITVKAENKRINLGPGIELFVDSSDSHSIHSISDPSFANQFKSSDETFPNMGPTKSTVWVRFSIRNITYNEHWILQAAYSDMESVELYIADGQNWKIKELGRMLPFFSRQIINRNHLFEIELPSNKESFFYLRYQSSKGMVIPLVLFSNLQYQIFALSDQFVFGLCLGFFLILSIYNLILFFKVREYSYLYYLLYIVGYTFFQFSIFGVAYQYFWPNSTDLENYGQFYFLGFAFLFRLIFNMSVLNSRKNTIKIHGLALGFLGAAVLAVLAVSFFSVTSNSWLPINYPNLFLWTALSFNLAFILLLLSINVVCAHKKIPGAKTLLLASLFMVIGIVIYGLKIFGFLPSNLFTQYGILAASICEMCILFITLGERMKAMKREAKEKERLQQSALQAYQGEQIRSMRLDLELLKANIHPHFILNSINAASMWLSEDPKTSHKLLQALSSELRQLLNVVDKKVIPFEEEIQICQCHLDLMSLRHDKKYSLTLNSIRMEEPIPPMVIHTLIENGLTHGYAKKDNGIFDLSRKETELYTTYRLTNDGESKAGKSESMGLGLRYVRARLEEAFPGRWELQSEPIAKGWCVTLRIKKTLQEQTLSINLGQ